MRYLFIILITILLNSNLYSQTNDSDTLVGKTFVKSPWALKLETGAIFHKMFNPNFINNKTTQFTEVTVSYESFYFTYAGFIYEFYPKQNMIYGKTYISTQNEFSSFNLNVALGYTYDFNKNWSSDIKIGFNSTDFEISNSEQTNINYKSDLIMGTQLGLGVDRYFKLKGFNYIVIGFGIEYYTTDYTRISENMKPTSLNYTFTIGYKGFFKKMID